MVIRNQKAFTVVELLMTIVIIAVLAGIAINTYSGIRQDSRDSIRQGNAVTISEALEKYYEKNGGYPSVASIDNQGTGNTGEAIANKLSIPVNSLVMPKMPDTATNAITGGPEPYEDYIVYLGQSTDNNEACQTDINGACEQFTLKYLEESGETKVIESRRTVNEIIAKPDLTVTAASTSSVNASWSTIANATGYTLQRSLSSDMSSPTVSSHGSTSTTATGLSASVTYYFRVQAIVPSGTSEWSDIESVTTNGIASPTGTLTIVASMSGTNAVGTAGGGSCAGGTTIEREIRYSSTNTSTAGSWSSYTAGASRSVSASQGWEYTFQQRARCTSGGSSSGWVLSGTNSTVRPVATPSAPSVVADPSNGNSVSWNWTSSCPSGTTASYMRQYRREGYTASWVGPVSPSTYQIIAPGQGYEYILEVQVRCSTTHSTSSWSTSGSAARIIPIATPGAATNFAGTLSGDRRQFTTTWTAPSCGIGTEGWWQRNNFIQGPNGSGIVWDITGEDGWTGWLAFQLSGPQQIFWLYSNNPIPPGTQYQLQRRYMCKNPVTGRQSTTGPIGTSQVFNL